VDSILTNPSETHISGELEIYDPVLTPIMKKRSQCLARLMRPTRNPTKDVEVDEISVGEDMRSPSEN